MAAPPTTTDGPPEPAPRPLAPTLRIALALAVGLGILARVWLVFQKPVWWDEIFTLDLARESWHRNFFGLLTDAPLHHLLAKAVLWPFPAHPGPADVLVRALSLLAALLHFPLLLRIGRRLDLDGRWACAAFALAPIAVVYAAEARAYAVTSLLLVMALDRALALRDAPSWRTAVLLALAAGGATLGHYMAVFPLAALAWLYRRPSPARIQFLAAGAGAAAIGLPLLLSSLRHVQPLDWATRADLVPHRLQRGVVNAVFGFDHTDPAFFCLLALMFVALLAFVDRQRLSRDAVGLLAGTVGLFAVAAAVVPGIFVPGRTAALACPLLALVVASASLPLRVGWACVVAAALAVTVPERSAASPSEQLARALLPAAQAGRGALAVGFYGPEVRYHLRRAHPSARVAFFPSDLDRHPGWYDDAAPAASALDAEASAIVSSPERPELYVLPFGARASQALRTRLKEAGGRAIGRTNVAEIWTLPPAAAPTR